MSVVEAVKMVEIWMVDGLVAPACKRLYVSISPAED